MPGLVNGDGPAAQSLSSSLFDDMGRQADLVSGQTDDEESRIVSEIESLCMNCHENGNTRLLLTKIPFFHEIIIMSFACDHCGFHNNEIQSAGEIQPQGAKYAFRLDNEADLQRQIVKSDVCVLRVEELDLEMPPGKGQFTNIEGIMSAVKDDLIGHQDERMRQMPEVGAKVAEVIRSLTDMLEGKRFPFTISTSDPSGNSLIEPKPGDGPGKWAKSVFNRSPAQNAALGLGEAPADGQAETNGDNGHGNGVQAPETEIRPEYHATGFFGADGANGERQQNNVDNEDIVENQVYSFPSTCPGCTRPCATNMKMVNIPYFKQVVLMSTVCDSCGYRSNEVKTGGEIPDKGRRTTLTVNSGEDLARDLLKSESAVLICPELGLRVEPGTMGGRFTTVEGILVQIRRDLRGQAFGLSDGDADIPEAGHDSMTSDSKRTWDEFFKVLTDAIEGRKHFTLTLEDPLAGSYVQSLTAPNPDPKITVEEYTRTKDEEDDLGLSDIKTEGYEADEADEE